MSQLICLFGLAASGALSEHLAANELSEKAGYIYICLSIHSCLCAGAAGCAEGDPHEPVEPDQRDQRDEPPGGLYIYMSIYT